MPFQGTQHRRNIATLLALLLCFFAVAVYSPLHVHENGDPKKCSLNDIEHQVADSVAPVLDLPKPIDERVIVEPAPTLSIPEVPARTASSRGPPTLAAAAAV